MGDRFGLYRRRSTGGAREHRVVIRHSDEEYARVQALAAANGVSMARLYERALHAGDVASAARLTQLATEARVVIRLMSKSAVNLNQLAVVANSTGEVNAAQVLAAARYFDEQVKRMEALLAAVSRGGVFDPTGSAGADSGAHDDEAERDEADAAATARSAAATDRVMDIDARSGAFGDEEG